MDVKLSMCLPKVFLEGSVSQILFKEVPVFISCLFYVKKRLAFCHFLISRFLHIIKSKLGPKSTF